MRQSRLQLEVPRRNRANAIRLYAGELFSENSADQAQPINLLSLYIQTMLRNLVPKNPRAMLSTFQGPAKASVVAAQTWANRQITKMNLAASLRRWVVDALFSCGWMKVGLATPSDSAMAAWQLKTGAPFAKTISLDDIAFDPHARDPEELAFIAHRFRVPLDTVKDSKLYSKARKKLQPSEDKQYNEPGDERAQELGRTQTGDDEEVQDMVNLWEVYCPRYRTIKVIPDDWIDGAIAAGASDEVLREDYWIGPERGPFHWLRFGIVPDNIMPKAPIQDLVTLHDVNNKLLRKLIRQAERQKTVLPVAGGVAEDMARLEGTDDGFGFRCENPDRLKEVVFGGPHQGNWALFMALKDMFSFMGGNLELLGGRGAQSPTATQDKMLNENASVGVVDMQETVINGVSEVIEALVWFWWHDPFTVMRTTYQIPGLPDAMSLPLQVTPQQRIRVPWEELDIRVDPYSLQHTTPERRLARLNQMVKEIILPLAPLLEKAGIFFDVHAWLEKNARYGDEPDLQELITIREPPMQDSSAGGSPELLAGAGESERTYNRTIKSEQTDKGFERNMMGALMGVDQGGSQNGDGQESM
jgi:hypothetical protein